MKKNAPLIISLLIILLAQQVRGEDVVPNYGAGARSTTEALAGLELLARSGKLSFEELKAVTETMARLREAMRERTRTEEESYLIEKLRTQLINKADSDKNNRLAALEAARFLLYNGDADKSLKYLLQAKPASQEDIEWPLLATRAYMQLGDYSRAAIFSERVENLLRQRNPLLLSNPIAVSQVTAFRLYQKVESNRFKPSDMLTLYIEISGAKFINSPGGGARCSLEFGLELRDQLQNPLDLNENYGKYDPVYVGEVRDLHATIYYRIPANLDPGEYTLIIYCRDEFNSGVKTQTEFVFNVAGGTRLPVPQDQAQEKARLRAAKIQQKISQNKAGDLLDSFGTDDDYDDLLNDASSKKKNVSKELIKNGMEMLLDQSRRAGDLINK